MGRRRMSVGVVRAGGVALEAGGRVAVSRAARPTAGSPLEVQAAMEGSGGGTVGRGGHHRMRRHRRRRSGACNSAVVEARVVRS